MPVPGASQLISHTVTQWQDVTSGPHRFGGVEYRLGNREIGHIHGDHMVDIPFPTSVRDEVVAGGPARPHHLLPDSGWVSLYLHSQTDIAAAIDLLRRSYDLALRQRPRRPKSTA